MKCVRVVDARRFRTPEERAGVVYCGRAWAGWPRSPWCNPFQASRHADALTRYTESLLARPDLDDHLRALWEATGSGGKPLACWCGDFVAGDGSEVVCHAQVLAELLAERFGRRA